MSEALRVKIELANRADDDGLRRVMRDTPMPGAVQIAFTYEPSFFDGMQSQGRRHDVVVGRIARTGEIAGLGTRSVKLACVNGEPVPVGYLSGLRILEPFRGTTGLARCYRLLRNRNREDPVGLYLTTIVEDNENARKILTSKRGGLPDYNDGGRFCCAAISLRQAPLPASVAGVTVRRATPGDVPAIMDLLAKEGPKKQFFPAYTVEDLLSFEGLLRGLAVEDILLAHEGGALIGITAAWDQRPYRQSVIAGYEKWLQLLRRPYNAVARMMKYPGLPPPGSTLDYLSLALTCVQDNDPGVFAALLAQVIEEYRSDRVFLMAGFHERDPLLVELYRYRHFPFRSRLYVVCWDDDAAFRGLDDRIPYLELGGL